MGVPIGRRALMGAGLAAALAGCSQKTDSGPTSSGGVTTLTYWSSLRGTDGVVAKFNESHPDIQVKLTDTPSGAAGTNAKIYNAATAGNAPDLITLDQGDVSQFAMDGVLTDITDYVSSDTISRLSPQAVGWGTFDDKTYALPTDVEPFVMFYNEALLGQYDLDVPTTWDEYRAMAETLHEKTGGEVRPSPFFTNSGNHLASYSWQAGAEWFSIGDDAWHVDIDGDVSSKISDYWQSMVDDGLIGLMPSDSQQWRAAMARDSLVTYMAGAWAGGALMGSVTGSSGDWRVAQLPQWDAASPSTGTQGGSSFAIPEGTANLEAAVEFLEWLVLSPDAFAAHLATGTSTAFPAAAENMGLAQDTFDTTYFGNQDIFALFGEAAETIGPDWTWGPRNTATLTSINDQLAKMSKSGTIAAALEAGQNETVHNLEALGLDVREGTAS